MKIEIPESLKSAYKLSNTMASVLFSGGTYVLTEQNTKIETLIDINHLLDPMIEVRHERVRIGSGANLQDFLNCAKQVHSNCDLMSSVRYSCPSKNVRNQRTFGGEIAQNCLDSEILTFFHAVNAQLSIFAEKDFQTSIRTWDGKGIITNISYFPQQIDCTAIQRFSVIPSASAIVSVAGILKTGNLEFAIGGKTKQITNLQIPLKKWNSGSAKNLSEIAKSFFFDDDYGSIPYKGSLIATAIKRVKAGLI